MKKILFVINTMGGAGAERALLEFLKRWDVPECRVYLYVIMEQGEMIGQLPSQVQLLNSTFSKESVLSPAGRRKMVKRVLKAFLRNGNWLGKLHYIIKILKPMVRTKRIQTDKLLWRMMAQGARRFDTRFDLAVAWLEGGSAYYVADYVKADKKAALVHINYEQAGYTREMDQGCWEKFDRIFAVSGETVERFKSVYPEYRDKMDVFPNIIDQEEIRRQAELPGGFTDTYEGWRILTVGRLSWQKGYDIAIEAMKLVKEAGCRAKWYVLGEGDQRSLLEKKISALGLEEDFLLLGAVSNPYPYFRQTDIYVHAVRYEGQSIAVQEAQTLGCPILVSNYSGSRQAVGEERAGMICELTPKSIADGIIDLLGDEKLRKELSQRAKTKKVPKEQGAKKLLGLLAEEGGSNG